METYVPIAAAEVDEEPATIVVPEANGGGAAGEPPKKTRRSRGEKVPRWSPEEEENLKRLVGEYGDRSWATVADLLGTGRTGAGVDQHWQIMSGKRKRNGKKVDSVGGTVVADAGSVVAHVAVTATAASSEGASAPPGPSSAAAANGASEGERVKKKRERRASGKILRWTPAEEEQLRALVTEHGTSGKWQQIADQLGTGRTGAGVDQHWQIMSGRRKSYTQRAGAQQQAFPSSQGLADGTAAEVPADVVGAVVAGEEGAEPPTAPAAVAHAAPVVATTVVAHQAPAGAAPVPMAVVAAAQIMVPSVAPAVAVASAAIAAAERFGV